MCTYIWNINQSTNVLSLHTMHRLAVESVNLKLAGGKRLKELAESILTCDSIAIPH